MAVTAVVFDGTRLLAVDYPEARKSLGHAPRLVRRGRARAGGRRSPLLPAGPSPDLVRSRKTRCRC